MPASPPPRRAPATGEARARTRTRTRTQAQRPGRGGGGPRRPWALLGALLGLLVVVGVLTWQRAQPATVLSLVGAPTPGTSGGPAATEPGRGSAATSAPQPPAPPAAGTSAAAPADPAARPLAAATATPASAAAAARTTATNAPAPVATATPRATPAQSAPDGRATATSAAATPRATASPSPTAVATPAPPPGQVARPTAAPPARADGPVVALTFDAGADRGYAEDILDLLRDEGVPASFGITGVWARANPDLVRRMAAEGHHVINHTQSHRSFTGLSDGLGGLAAARRRAELEEADAVIAPLLGRSTRPWYRLPYGDDDARVAGDVAPAGYTRKAGWTVDSLGWRGLSAAEIAERCLRLAAPGAVYVLHVGRSSQDGPALGRIVAGLRARGFGFATMADLP